MSLVFLSLWFILRYKQWVRKGIVTKPVRKWPHSQIQLVLYTDHNGKEKPVHGGHSSWLQIFAFGIGSVAYLVSVLIQVASETNLDGVQVAKSSISLACCIVFIMFLKLYNGVFLKNTRFFQYSIAVMIGANVCEWISITISPFREHSATNVNMSIISNSSIFMSDHTEGNNFELVFDTIHSFLHPFFVEFLSISAECLFELRKTMTVNGRYHIEYKPANTDIESHLSLGDISNSHNESKRIMETNEDHFQNYQAIKAGRPLTHSNADPAVSLLTLFGKVRKHETKIFVVISACATAFYVVVYFVVNVPMTPVNRDNGTIEILDKIDESFVFGPLIVSLFVALYKLNKMNICMRNLPHFTSTDYLLLFTSSAIFVHNILRMIALIGLLVVRSKIDTYGTIFQIIFWALSIVHIWGQTQFIMTAQWLVQILRNE